MFFIVLLLLFFVNYKPWAQKPAGQLKVMTKTQVVVSNQGNGGLR